MLYVCRSTESSLSETLICQQHSDTLWMDNGPISCTVAVVLWTAKKHLLLFFLDFPPSFLLLLLLLSLFSIPLPLQHPSPHPRTHTCLRFENNKRKAMRLVQLLKSCLVCVSWRLHISGSAHLSGRCMALKAAGIEMINTPCLLKRAWKKRMD